MTATSTFLRVSALCSLVLFANVGHIEARRRHKQRSKPAADAASRDQKSEELAAGEVSLTLSDGTKMRVDEAWESEQGIWYRQGGITHLLSRDRAKAIKRGSEAKPKEEPQVAEVTEMNSSNTSETNQPVWIHLVGGAKLEVDSATESAAGVWYRRGSLSLFLERSRIDHIERETLAKSDASKTERGWSSGSQKIDSLIKQNGARYSVDPYLIFLVMEQESHFNSRAVSPKGARGLMQLMPGTSARFGVRRPHDPAQNIAGGTRFLRQLLDQFNGRVDLVLASYNAGEGAVRKFGHRVPPYRETRDYVKRISYRYRRAKASIPSRPGSTTGAGRT